VYRHHLGSGSNIDRTSYTDNAVEWRSEQNDELTIDTHEPAEVRRNVHAAWPLESLGAAAERRVQIGLTP
jgi:hypothetical protein